MDPESFEESQRHRIENRKHHIDYYTQTLEGGILKAQIDILVNLCRRYGTSNFVSGGGGNVSWKNQDVLWIKASGTYLAEADETTLVAVNRNRLGDLYRSQTPQDPAEREAWAKQIVQHAVEDSLSPGRPSVETPLHDLFEAAYVVHTHPPLINGLACAQNAVSACNDLFPMALWVPYVDPGVTLCLQVRRQFEDYFSEHGREPSIIIMQNHGLVVAADQLSEIDLIHERVFKTLEDTYKNAGLSTNFPDFVTEELSVSPVTEPVAQAGSGQVIMKCTGIDPAPGPLTPDHVVYSGVEAMSMVNDNALNTYRERFGSDPRLFIHAGELYAQGASHTQVKVACDLAADGAFVLRLTEAFGGAKFMTEEQWRFVINWEAESYRQSVTESYDAKVVDHSPIQSDPDSAA